MELVHFEHVPGVTYYLEVVNGFNKAALSLLEIHQVKGMPLEVLIQITDLDSNGRTGSEWEFGWTHT